MPAYTLSNRELSALLKAGSRDAFTEIYSRYWKKLLLIAWNDTADKVVAEDLVQEVFTSLWENRNRIDVENIEAYLVTAIKFSSRNGHTEPKHRCSRFLLSSCREN